MESLRRNLWRSLGYTLAILALILVVAVLVVELMSWNFLKPTITQRVEDATGRTMQIDGDVSVSLFPVPHISLNDLILSNPAWAESDYLARLDRLKVTPALIPLLSGDLVLAEVLVEGPQVNLEARANGSGNWVFSPSSNSGTEEQATTTEQNQSDSLPVTVRHLAIDDAGIHYYPPQADTPVELTFPTVRVNSDDKSLNAKAKAVFRSRRFNIQASADPLNDWLGATGNDQGQLSITSGDSLFQASVKQLEKGGKGEASDLSGKAELSLADPSAWSQWLGGPRLDLGAFNIATSIDREPDSWEFHNLSISADGTQLTGAVTLYTGQAPRTFSAKLAADRLSVDNLLDVLPESPNSQDSQKADSQPFPANLQLPVLPAVAGNLEVDINQLTFRQAVLEDIQATLSLADHTLTLESLKLAGNSGTAEGSGQVTSSPETLAAELNLTAQNIGLAPFIPGGDISGSVDAQIETSLGPLARSPSLEPKALIKELQISQARVSYQGRQPDIDLQAELDLASESNAPVVTIEGEYDQQPFQLTVEGDPLQTVLDESEYVIQAQATSGDLGASLSTNLASLTSPETLTADIRAHGEGGGDLEALVGFSLPPVPEFSLDTHLRREQAVWSMNPISLELGKTGLSGILRFYNRARPLVELELEGERIDLASLIALSKGSTGGSSSQGPADSESTLVELMNSFDLQLVIEAGTVLLPEDRELNDLTVIAQLEEGMLDVEPLRFNVGGGSLNAGVALDASSPPATGELDVRVDNLSLGRLSDSFLMLDEKLGKLTADIHLNAVQASAGGVEDDVLLSSLGRLSFDESQVSFRDEKAQTDFTLSIDTEGLKAEEQSLRILGRGQYDGEPFSLQLWTDPLLDLRHPQQPFSVELSSEIVDTHLSLEGEIQGALALKGLNFDVSVSGPDTNRLERVLGVPLPELPPYSISGALSLIDDRWSLTNLEGIAGTSDISGHLAMDVRVSPPRVTGDLYSDSIDLDDFGGLVGADTKDGATGSVAPPPQPEEPSQEPEDRLILPDEPIVAENLDQLSANINYKARSIRITDVPLSDLALDLSLENGVMRLKPVSFGVGDGNVDLTATLDSTVSPPEGTVAIEVRGVDLRKALNEWELTEDSVGIVGGRGKFWIQGVSVSDLLASADGGLVLLMTQGRLDAILVELAGLDIVESLYAWLSEDMEIPLNCAYVDVKAEDGLATLDTVLIDSQDSVITAGGVVDFNTEKLDITFLTHPKDFSLITARTPLHLGGTFAEIEPGLHGSALSLRLATGLALSTIAAPIAALMPMLEVGATNGTGYCQGLVSRLRSAIQEEGAEE